MARRVAVVTGAGSGLGAVATDIDAHAADAMATEIGGESDAFDVADSAAADRVIDAVVARHGRIVVLVNNAGIAPSRPAIMERSAANMLARMSGAETVPLDSLVELADDEWDRMITSE